MLIVWKDIIDQESASPKQNDLDVIKEEENEDDKDDKEDKDDKDDGNMEYYNL